MNSPNAGIVLCNELSAMAWEILLANHPDRRDELNALWRELQQAAAHVRTDPAAHAEWTRRFRRQYASLETEFRLEVQP